MATNEPSLSCTRFGHAQTLSMAMSRRGISGGRVWADALKIGTRQTAQRMERSMRGRFLVSSFWFKVPPPFRVTHRTGEPETLNQKPSPPSRQHLLDHIPVHIGKPVVAALELEGQPRVVDPEAM